MPAASEYINEYSYKDLFDNAHDLIHFADPQGNILKINRAWTKVTGYTAAEVEGKTIFTFIQEPDRERYKDYQEKLLAGEAQEEQITFGIHHADGNLIYLQGFASLKNDGSTPDYIRGIFRDVTPHLKNETLIREREANLNQLLINAPDAVIVIDENSNVIFWNPMCEKLFGWTAGEVLHRNLAETIVPHRYRHGHQHGMQRYMSTGVPRVVNKTVDITALNKAGEEFNISLTISSTKQDGKHAFIAFIRDISEKKRNEAELEKRTKELEASNEQLQQFAHVASHDMKEPVRKIMMFVERLTLGYANQLPQEAISFLDKIRNSSMRLRNIVEGFLNYASIDTFREDFQPVDLNRILKQIEEDLELRIQERNAVISFGIFPVFDGVPFLIYQLFFNLISNSLKFSREDVVPQIMVSVENAVHGITLNEGEYITISVKDNGIGFKEENRQKLFRIFSRLNHSRHYEGSGIGLALCKNIVDRHKGFITASGIPGEGASFFVSLPSKQQ